MGLSNRNDNRAFLLRELACSMLTYLDTGVNSLDFMGGISNDIYIIPLRTCNYRIQIGPVSRDCGQYVIVISSVKSFVHSYYSLQAL